MKSYAILTPAIAAGLLFTACNKELSQPANEPDQNTSSITLQMNNVDKSGRFYGVTSTGGDHVAAGIISWNSGFANAAAITLEKGDVKGNYTTQLNKKLELFDVDVNIGSIMVPAGMVDNATYALTLQPVGGIALQLQGEYTNNSAVTMPVTLNIEEPLTIKTPKMASLNMKAGAKYIAKASVSFGTMLMTIPEDLMINAERQSNGSIEISSKKNIPLYNAIKSALTNLLQVEIDNNVGNG